MLKEKTMNQYYINRYIDNAIKREIRHCMMHQDGMLDSLKAKLKEQASKLKETINKFRELPASQQAAKIATRCFQAIALIIAARSVRELYLGTKKFKKTLKFLEMFINSEFVAEDKKESARIGKSNLIFKYRLKTILHSLVMIGSLVGTYLGQKVNKSI
jgi:hypothetical protein